MYVHTNPESSVAKGADIVRIMAGGGGLSAATGTSSSSSCNVLVSLLEAAFEAIAMASKDSSLLLSLKKGLLFR